MIEGKLGDMKIVIISKLSWTNSAKNTIQDSSKKKIKLLTLNKTANAVQ